MPRSAPLLRSGLALVCILCWSTAGQRSAKASRPPPFEGTVQDPTGAVLPGATVTVTNTGTKAVADDGHRRPRAVPLCRPLPRHLRPQGRAAGFKTYEQKARAAQPERQPRHRRAARGRPADRDRHGHRADEVIQTETGAREGVLTRQADRQSLDHRPQLARAAAHPAGRRHRIQHRRVGQLRRRRQQHPGLYGQRHPLVEQHGLARRLVAHRHRQQQRRHRVAEQRHGSGSQGPELELRGRVRHRRHERERRDQVRHARSSTARLYDYWRDHELRGQRSLEQHHRHGQAEEHVPVSRRQRRRPDHLRRQLHEEQATSCSSSSRSKASGSRSTPARSFTRTFTQAMQNGDFSELLANRGSNLNSIPQLRIPQGFPDAGQPAPNNDMRPYMHRYGPVPGEPRIPMPNYNDPDQPVQLRVQPRSSRTNRYDFKARFDWNISNSTKAYVRIAQEGETVESPRGVWWAPADVVALPTPNVGTTAAGRTPGNVVSVLSPSMTNEILVSYSRLTLDNRFKDPRAPQQGAGGDRPSTASSPPARRARTCRPTSSTGGAAAARSGTCGRKAERRVRAQRRAAVQQQADEARRRARPEVRHLGRARPEAAELPEQRGGSALVRHRQRRPAHGQLRRPTCSSAASASSTRARARTGNPSPGSRSASSGTGTSTRSRRTAGSSGRTSPSNTASASATGPTTRSLIGLGGYFDPALYNPNAGHRSSIPAPSSALNGVCYVETGARPPACWTTARRSRCRASTSPGTSTARATTSLRGGYGHVLQPQHGQRRVRQHAAARRRTRTRSAPTSGPAASYGGGVGLTYDTVREATLANRIGSIGINSLDAGLVQVAEDAQLQRCRTRAAFRSTRSSRSRYVGTRGRDLVSRSNGNVMPLGVAELRHVQRRRPVGARSTASRSRASATTSRRSARSTR